MTVPCVTNREGGLIEIGFAASAILEGAEKAVLALRGINVGSFLAAAFIESQIGRMESVIGELYDAAEAEARQDISTLTRQRRHLVGGSALLFAGRTTRRAGCSMESTNH